MDFELLILNEIKIQSVHCFVTVFLKTFSFLDPTFFSGRCAELIVRGKSIGFFGVIHPEVLSKFELPNPCAALEITIEPFL